MPTITAKVSDELLAYIDQVSGGNRSEYLRRCLEAGPGDLESGLKIVTNQLSDVNRKLDYLFDRASDADFGSLRGTVAKLAMRQPFVLFKGLTFQKLCLPGAFRPGDHHNKM
ncbi:hypothetical protein, partial [Escherichia coli]|uniref:hypothetical protein n=1 Tax=Escherichia coli TaxID=562 RepID=UPI0032DE9868